MATLNEAFSALSVRRRYEVWFLRLGLADGSGAWWFRYLLMNPGRDGCVENLRTLPVQVWATWFPTGGKPESFIRGFPRAEFEMSERGISPFHFRAGHNEIGEDFCRGALDLGGHAVSWDLRYRSTFRVTLSSKGWIGFSRTPHSDAIFSGEITLDTRRFAGDPLGFGVQGHNCGYRHRNFWNWMHAYFPRTGKAASTLEALFYEMPFGLVFRKAVLWHDGQPHVFRKFHEMGTVRDSMRWNFQCADRELRLEALVDGSGPSIHRLPYVKTDCSGSFEVTNNSLASASLTIENRDGSIEQLETSGGAVLEIVG